MNLTKSIEQLEDHVWSQNGDFPSGLVERCFNYRKVPIGSLTNEQLRTLLAQRIGITYILPIVIAKLEKNPLCGGNLYEGDLLESTMRVEVALWKGRPDLYFRYRKIIEKNHFLIVDEIGEKKLNRIKEEINKVQIKM